MLAIFGSSTVSKAVDLTALWREILMPIVRQKGQQTWNDRHRMPVTHPCPFCEWWIRCCSGGNCCPPYRSRARRLSCSERQLCWRDPRSRNRKPEQSCRPVLLRLPMPATLARDSCDIMMTVLSLTRVENRAGCMPLNGSLSLPSFAFADATS